MVSSTLAAKSSTDRIFKRSMSSTDSQTEEMDLIWAEVALMEHETTDKKSKGKNCVTNTK